MQDLQNNNWITLDQLGNYFRSYQTILTPQKLL